MENKKEIIKEVSIFENGLLYGKYAVISNKTIRNKEKLLIRWKNNDKNVPGKELTKTNRGYFIDGYNVDLKSTNEWFNFAKIKPNSKTKKSKK